MIASRRSRGPPIPQARGTAGSGRHATAPGTGRLGPPDDGDGRVPPVQFPLLVPLEKPQQRPLGFVSGYVSDAFFEPLPEEELASWGDKSKDKL